MIEIYRKRKDSVDAKWHFHTQCPDWPENDFIQTLYLKRDELERICPECCKVNAKMFPISFNYTKHNFNICWIAKQRGSKKNFARSGKPSLPPRLSVCPSTPEEKTAKNTNPVVSDRSNPANSHAKTPSIRYSRRTCTASSSAMLYL